MEQNKQDLQKTLDSIQPVLASFKKELMSLVNNAISVSMAENIAAIQEYGTANQQTLEQHGEMVVKQYQEYRNYADAQLAILSGKIDAFDKIMRDSITGYQQETISKVSALNEKVDKLVTFMKKFSDGLA